MQCILMAKHRFLQWHLNQPQQNPSIPERCIWKIDLWFWIGGPYFSFLLIFVFGLLNSQISPSICFFLDLVPVFLLLFVLFGIIYKIDFFSILFLFDFFHLLDLVIILFIVVAPDITVVLKNQWKRNIIDFWCLVLW